MLRVFNSVLQQLNNLVVVVDSCGEVAYVGPSAERMLGYKTGELMGNKWWAKTSYTVTDAEQRKTEVSYLMKQIANGKSVIAPVEHRINTATGESKWFSWNLSAGPDGSLVQIGYDITDKKLKEQELLGKNKELANRNKEIFDSLEYARNIQQAILPSADKLKGNFAEAFTFYQPKDVVSGDFYWAYFDVNENTSYHAVVDCTGHGVPGALMTIMANSLLKDIVVKRKVTEPKDVLSILDEELQQMINAQGNRVKASDGMDIAVCKFNKTTGELTYGGAFRPMVVVSDGVLTEYLGSRYPIGFYHNVVKIFEQTTVQVKPGDLVYFFTDGFADQFGGERSKKFNKKNFKDLLLSINDMELEVQRSFLEYSLLNWRQKEPQTDDVLVVGFKV
jgi:PAS domain S-box-containing protein